MLALRYLSQRLSGNYRGKGFREHYCSSIFYTYHKPDDTMVMADYPDEAWRGIG